MSDSEDSVGAASDAHSGAGSDRESGAESEGEQDNRSDAGSEAGSDAGSGGGDSDAGSDVEAGGSKNVSRDDGSDDEDEDDYDEEEDEDYEGGRRSKKPRNTFILDEAVAAVVVLLCLTVSDVKAAGSTSSLMTIGKALGGLLGSVGGGSGNSTSGKNSTSFLSGVLSNVGSQLGMELLDGAKQFIGKLTGYINDNLLGNHPFQVVLGRGVRIHQNGNSVSIQDVSSGLTASGHGATPEEALSNATANFVALMLNIGIISKDDLHLAPAPRTTAAVPCGDNFPDSYCRNYRHMCANSALTSFLKKNCYKTCSGC